MKVAGSNPDWVGEHINYLWYDILPPNKDEANRVHWKAKSYVMRDDKIQHKSMTRILQ